jgi:hypothetical protein
MKNNWVMDYETLSNCFVGCFISHNSNETKVFKSTKFDNDHADLIAFLEDNIKNNQWHISYNGLAFDSQITEHILDNKSYLLKKSGEEFAIYIFNYAQSVINKSRNKEFLDYPSWRLSIKQLDIFKLNHWDNPAKSSSLKWIQYSMDWFNIKEMPIHYTTHIDTVDQVSEIVSYCINDVESTKAILHLSKEQIMLRNSLSKEYDLDLYSASEPRISKELFAHFLSDTLKWDKKELKSKRTYRDSIVLKDCILPNITFKTPVFNKLLEFFNSKIITETKGSLKYSLDYKGVKTEYGLGGIHGAREAGIYEAKDGMTIMTSDVTSFYPNLAIENNFSPKHLPQKEFLELYKWFFEERKLIPKKDPKNYVYKIILNSTYGLSNDANSFLYDPKFTMRITINGQLQLSMLYEMLSEGIPEGIPLMQNTDGLEMMIPTDKIDLYYEICSNWEKLTRLQLEHDQYQKLILRDVNNYIAVYKNGKTKCKGFFEFDNLALHKNKSFLIIPKAVYAYLVDGIKPEDYLTNNQNIMDYCAGIKSKGEWYYETRCLDVDNNNESYLKKTKLQKINRYFISTNGIKIVKCHPDGREIQVEAGKWKQTVYNNINELKVNSFDEYHIDISYYLNAIYKEITNVNKRVSKGYTQIELF